MKRRSKTLLPLCVLIFFGSAVWCATMAAPGQALASVTGCSQMAGGMAMLGCENPNYLCGFNPASNLLSHGAVTSTRSHDSFKDALGLALGAAAIDVSTELTPPGAKEWKNGSLAEPGKVPVRLLNSTLNL